MDKDIHQVVSDDVVPVKIVIEGKGYIGYGTIGGSAVCDDFHQIPGAETGQADMRIVPNVGQVVKDERSAQRIGIDDDNNQCCKNNKQFLIF